MNYALAKELKDAGFPTKPLGLWITKDNSEPHLLPKNIQPGDIIATDYKDHAVYVPTLSELIEACGKDFASLEFHPNDETGPRWWTASHLSSGMIETMGDTPEEAVARLWLALNKQKA